MQYQLLMPFDSDATIYWLVGRGILEGFIPYADFITTKPPGILLISAASFAITQSPMFGYVLQIIAHCTVAFIVPISTLHVFRNEKSPVLFMGALLASLVYGCVLAKFSAVYAGAFLTESFAAALGSVFVYLYIRHPDRVTKKYIILQSIVIFLCAGIKEPMILVLFACALLLTKHTFPLLRKFFLPLGLGMLWGLIALVITKTFVPFFTIYLPRILTSYVPFENTSMWYRVVNISQSMRTVYSFSSLLALLIVMLLFAIILQETQKQLSKKSVVFMGKIFLAIICVSFAVAMSNRGYSHYTVQAVPFFITIFLLFLKNICQAEKRNISMYSTACVAALIIAAFPIHTRNLQAASRAIAAEYTRLSFEASVIDDVLDKCDQEKYLFIGTNGKHPFGFTKHFPYGPAFIQGNAFSIEMPYVRERFIQALMDTSLIVFHDMNLQSYTDEFNEYAQQNFTSIPWTCAALHTNVLGKYTLFFRIDV